MTFVNCDLFNAYCCRSAERCFYELGLCSNPAFLWAVGGSVIGQLCVIYFAPLQEVFQTEALSGADLLYIISLSSSILVLDTIRKKFFPSYFSDGYKESPRAYKKDDDLLSSRAMKHSTSWLSFGRGTNKAKHAGRFQKRSKKKSVLAV
jgi:Ca2+-transporting ATPase